MDNITLKNVEEGATALEVDVINSSNLQDTNKQQSDLTFAEDNVSEKEEAVLSNITQENIGVNYFNISDISTRKGNSALLPVKNVSVVTSVASKSLLNIMEYGSSSGSSIDDSEPDFVDLIEDSKSSESSDSDWEEIPSNDNVNNVRNYRDGRCPSSGDTSDSNESLDNDIEVGAIGAVKPPPKKNNRTEEELELDDLPLIPDLSKLSINVKPEDCIQMGKISNIIDRLVTIESLPNTPAYNLDTLLFLDHGKVPLGHIYDVIGQVTSPIYVVRFNSKEEIESRGITKGLPVYCAPNTEHTQFVFLKELLRMKGSDASWQGDNEVPVEFVDFSDDDLESEQSKPHNTNERSIRKKKRNSLDRHKIFETTMNLKNEVNSARYKIQDVIEPPAKREAPKRNLKFYYPQPPCHVRPPLNRGFNSYPLPNFALPPNFNMVNMPPPMFNVPAPQYPIMHFPPNPQFPPPTFGSPAIPPLPHMPHIPAQPPPPPPGYHPMLSTNIPLPVCKPIPQIPKMLQNSGVVPKIRPPRKYTVPNSTTRQLQSFVNNTRQNLPSTLASRPYGPVLDEYHTSPPKNPGETQFKNS